MYDKKGDYHYDIASAFIKSMRGSDPQAALHYLARMIAGEKNPFISRRIIICAAEDVGLADPDALRVAVSAAQAAEMVDSRKRRLFWRKQYYIFRLLLKVIVRLSVFLLR